jgi:hypothetical protein
MLDKKLKYPAFDSLELTTELEFINQPYERLHPKKPGDTITGLLNYPFQPKQNLLVQESTFRQAGLAVPLLNKILVVYFYSRHWAKPAWHI